MTDDIGKMAQEIAEQRVELGLDKTCPRCGHPMMSGPIQPKRGSGDYRVADWYCANCHHVIWAKGDTR